MSLVVAQIQEQSIAIVADTKIAYSDEVKKRHVFEYPLPKIAILREDLAVSYACDRSASEVLEAVVRIREYSLSEVLARVRKGEVDPFISVERSFSRHQTRLMRERHCCYCCVSSPATQGGC